MSELWQAVVEMAAKLLAVVSGVYGGNLGWAVVTVSIAFRLALLPWMVRMARQGQQLRERLKALQPELDALKQKHGEGSDALGRATVALYQQHGVQPGGQLVGLLVQLPPAAAIYAAIRSGVAAGGRFLWVRTLAAPDAWVAAIAVGLGMLAAAIGGQGSGVARWAPVVVSGVVTAIFLAKLASGLALYMAASSAVGVLQAVLLRPKGGQASLSENGDRRRGGA